MEAMVKSRGTAAMPPIRKGVLQTTCAHGRLIDDVLTDEGQRTGRVRCLECLAVIDDPYGGTK